METAACTQASATAATTRTGKTEAGPWSTLQPVSVWTAMETAACTQASAMAATTRTGKTEAGPWSTLQPVSVWTAMETAACTQAGATAATTRTGNKYYLSGKCQQRPYVLRSGFSNANFRKTSATFRGAPLFGGSNPGKARS